MANTDLRNDLAALPLQNISLAYKAPGMVWNRVAPTIDLPSPKAKITKWNKGDLFRNQAGLYVAGSRPTRIDVESSYVDVATALYGAEAVISESELAASENPGAPTMSLLQDKTEFANRALDLRIEKRLKDLIVATAWSGQGAGGEDAAGLWAPVGSTNTMVTDVIARKATIQTNTGCDASQLSLLMDFKTFDAARRCDEVRGWYQSNFGSTGIVSEANLAALLGIKEVIVGYGMLNTEVKHKAGDDGTFAPIWSVNTTKGMAFLFYAEPRPGLRTASALYHARNKVMLSNLYRATYNYSDGPTHVSNIIQVFEDSVDVVCASDLGFQWVDTNES